MDFQIFSCLNKPNYYPGSFDKFLTVILNYSVINSWLRASVGDIGHLDKSEKKKKKKKS